MELIKFQKSLKRATIINRPNRFIVNVDLEGVQVKAHCPVAGSIGGISLDGLPCIVSEAPKGSKRSTTHTMEAFALEKKPKMEWIGINQTQVNRYVEAAINLGALGVIPGFAKIESIKREPRIRDSRLDFLVNDDIYVEVKTPIKNLQVDLPSHIVVKDKTSTGTERMLRQVKEMMEFLDEVNKRAVILTAFIYDNPGFKVPEAHNSIYNETLKTMNEAFSKGLERWQVNFKINENGVYFDKILPFSVGS